MEGFLILSGWAGRWKQAVRIVGETPKKYRIEPVDKPVRLAGKQRYLHLGETILVPKHAVKISDRPPLKEGV